MNIYVIRPESPSRSPLDVPGIKLNLTADEIVKIVREGRERGYTASDDRLRPQSQEEQK